MQRFSRLFCNGTAYPLPCLAAAWDVVWADDIVASDTGFAIVAVIDLVAALWHWYIIPAAFGSKGNNLAFQFIFLLCLSSAMGGKHVALPPFISGTLCSDIGVVCAAFFVLRRFAGSTVSFCITRHQGRETEDTIEDENA